MLKSPKHLLLSRLIFCFIRVSAYYEVTEVSHRTVSGPTSVWTMSYNNRNPCSSMSELPGDFCI